TNAGADGSERAERTTASPFARGMSMSSTATRGMRSVIMRNASSPSPASPTTTNDGSAATTARNPARKSGWSSAMTIGIGAVMSSPQARYQAAPQGSAESEP